MHPNDLSSPDVLPEIEVETSQTSSKEKISKLIKNETSITDAIQIVINYIAEAVTEKIIARLNHPESPATTPTSTKKREVSEETRRRISEAQKSRWATSPNRKLSVEARQRISDAQKARWATKDESTVNTSREPSTDSEGDRQDQTRELVVTASKEAVAAFREGYKGDAFYTSESGQFIGNDGFVVPKDFNEFIERYPRYIENWVRRRLGGKGVEEDIEDWVQELIIHMKYLPQTSKHRVAGKEDVIQTFDPFAQYGASERRWRSYVNNCLTNKYNTIFGKRNKNPVCRAGNVSLVSETNADSHGEMTDEYAYSRSQYLTDATNREEQKQESSFFAHSFLKFVHETDPNVFPVLEAVYVAGSATDTVKEFCLTCKKLATTKEVSEGEHKGHDIGMTQKDFNRARNRLKKLAMLFVKKKKLVTAHS